jgi:hypothetical protein
MPSNTIQGEYQNLGPFTPGTAQPLPTPDDTARRMGFPSLAALHEAGMTRAPGTWDARLSGGAFREAMVGGAAPGPDPIEPDPTPITPISASPAYPFRKCRLFWYMSFANTGHLPRYGGVFAGIMEKGWNLALRDGWWPGHEQHQTVDSLLARHPFALVDRSFGVTATEFVVGYGANGQPGTCGVLGPTQADPAVLNGYVTAWRLRARRVKERKGELACYMGSPPYAATYSATSADNWFKIPRQAEFDGIALDVGAVLKQPAPAYVVANRAGNYGMKCWMEPPDAINDATAHNHSGRFGMVCMEAWANDTIALGRHRPATLNAECMVILDVQSGTPEERIAKAVQWRNRGWSVACDPSGFTPAQLDQVVGAFR